MLSSLFRLSGAASSNDSALSILLVYTIDSILYPPCMHLSVLYPLYIHIFTCFYSISCNYLSRFHPLYLLLYTLSINTVSLLSVQYLLIYSIYLHALPPLYLSIYQLSRMPLFKVILCLFYTLSILHLFYCYSWCLIIVWNVSCFGGYGGGNPELWSKEEEEECLIKNYSALKLFLYSVFLSLCTSEPLLYLSGINIDASELQ